MLSLELNTPSKHYPIHIGRGLLEQGELLLPGLAGQRVAVVTNTTVAPLYLPRLTRTLEALGKQVLPIVLPDGEAHKTWTTLNLIFDALLSQGAERSTPLLALGGGVIGDITGFAAAVYQRGVPFVQVPTTLLAQVDSSVGGKTAINHPMGKNMIGAFYQPELVLADVATLETLPDQELSAGLAEVIKYGLIGDLEFLDWLDQNVEVLLQRDQAALSHAIARSCANKARVVAGDEREQGLRAILNFGHTFGHAVETAMGYGSWLHGEAVAVGMLLAARVSNAMGWLTLADVERIEQLLRRAHLPVQAPELGFDRWMELMGHDKKVEAGKIRFVLLKELGEAVITSEVPLTILRQYLR